MIELGERIMLIGSAGAGKTTLARKLHKKYQYPLYHLDRYYWKAGWQDTPNEEFSQIVTDFASQENWIIDGNYNKTIHIRLERATTVIFLDINRWVCVFSAIKRVFKNWKKQRNDIGEGCLDTIDFSFLLWIIRFNRVAKPTIIKNINSFPHVNVITLKSRKEINEFAEKYNLN